MRYAMIRGAMTDVNAEHVYDRMSGLCGQIDCGAPVTAFKGPNAFQRGGSGQRFHFRHDRGYGKGCCYDGVSPLHDFAQHCLGRSGGMVLPDWDFAGNGHWERFTAPVRFEHLVRIGRKEGGFRRPDVVTATRSSPIAIEITVTCGLTPQRIADLTGLGFRVLEIMLKDMPLIDFDEDLVRNAVVDGLDRKFWREASCRSRSPRQNHRASLESEIEVLAAQCDLFEQVPADMW